MFSDVSGTPSPSSGCSNKPLAHAEDREGVKFRNVDKLSNPDR